MSDVASEVNRISRLLMSLERSTKPKMLVVDDEPDNLDLLYRTFRRDFNVIRAESGRMALEILATEGEVAVIISDQRMPEMKGTEFLSRTVLQFPDTMRIILTGFTDVEDLVDAINSGQVYKYITKPWDPSELKVVVQRATAAYELLKQRTQELRRVQAQMSLLSTLVGIADHASQTDLYLQAGAAAFGETFLADRCILRLTEADHLGKQGTYGVEEGLDDTLAAEPLIQQAIATQSMQLVVDAPAHAGPVAGDSAAIDTPVSLLVPLSFQAEVLGVLMLHWKQPCALRENELTLIRLAAQQIGMTLACNRSDAALERPNIP